jgi:two-component system sensor histidine kinase/response regulator
MEQENLSPKASSSTRAEGYTGTILVVDDEEINRDILRALIESHGYTVIEAVNGEEALRRIAEASPDVILLDIMMPIMDGFETCRKLKADPLTAPIPVLLVTSLTDRSDRLKGIEAGANDFLNKPIDAEDVLLRVRNALFAKRLYDEIQENYRKLKELEGLKDNLILMIVHDLRQPITALSLSMQLLMMQDDNALLGDKKEIIEQAFSATNTLIEMVSSLLDVNKLEDGKMKLNMSSCDLKDLTEETVGKLGPLKADRNISVQSTIDNVGVICDVELIRRVISNLTGNALKFTPRNGEIRIIIQSEDSRIKIAVSDNGIGIPKEFHKRIFEKFGQVQTRKEGKKYSTGLGLTFCKLAVEAHGGEIGVQSEPGKGSTFWFILPREPKSLI